MNFQYCQVLDSEFSVCLFLMAVTENFRQNLRSELDYEGLTVKELSAKTGIAKATLDCYLGARANMPLADAAVKIARALGSTVEYLITGQDSEKNKASKTLRPDARLRTFSPDLRSIINIYEQLDKADREKLLEIAKVFKKKNSYSTG
jgi:transcriptional regulator with XRE-family HTH domain